MIHKNNISLIWQNTCIDIQKLFATACSYVYIQQWVFEFTSFQVWLSSKDLQWAA